MVMQVVEHRYHLTCVLTCMESRHGGRTDQKGQSPLLDDTSDATLEALRQQISCPLRVLPATVCVSMDTGSHTLLAAFPSHPCWPLPHSLLSSHLRHLYPCALPVACVNRTFTFTRAIAAMSPLFTSLPPYPCALPVSCVNRNLHKSHSIQAL